MAENLLDIDAAYLAGLFDGEGTITLCQPSNRNSFRAPMISISSTDIELLDRAVEIADAGWIQEKKHIKRKGWKPAYEFRIKNQAAIDLAARIRRFVHCPEKARRIAMLVDEYPALTRRNGKYSDEEKAAKREFERRFLRSA